MVISPSLAIKNFHDKVEFWWTFPLKTLKDVICIGWILLLFCEICYLLFQEWKEKVNKIWLKCKWTFTMNKMKNNEEIEKLSLLMSLLIPWLIPNNQQWTCSLYLENNDLIFSPSTLYTTYQAHFMRLIAVLRKIKPKPGEFFSFVLLFLISSVTLSKYFIFSIALSSVSDGREGVLTVLWGCRM